MSGPCWQLHAKMKSRFSLQFVAHHHHFGSAACVKTETGGRIQRIVANETVAFLQSLIDGGLVACQIPSQRALYENMGVDATKEMLVGENYTPDRAQGVPIAVGVGSSNCHHALPLCQETIPQTYRVAEGALDPEVRKMGIKKCSQSGLAQRLEFGHIVPQFNAGVAVDLPIVPGDCGQCGVQGRAALNRVS